MYNEIKSGAACNTLVTEYILRKNPRGDAEIDTEESPFLRDNLRGKLPSLAERKRRRQRRHAASNPAALGMKPSVPSMKLDAAASAQGATAITDHDLQLPNMAGGGREGNLAQHRFDQNREKVTQNVGGEGLPHQARGASRSKSPHVRDRGPRDEMERPGEHSNCEESTDNGLAESGSSSREGHKSHKNQSRSRRRGRAGDIENKHFADKAESLRGRRGGRRRQGEPGNHPLNGKTELDSADSSIGQRRRRRRGEETIKNSSCGDRVSRSLPRLAGEVDGRRRQQVTTIASLKTLSLPEMEEREDDSTSQRKVDDALDRWVRNG